MISRALEPVPVTTLPELYKLNHDMDMDISVTGVVSYCATLMSANAGKCNIVTTSCINNNNTL